jgi:hypothetical protein
MINQDNDLESWLQLAVEHPVFIVGTMRSGTSFLGQALNQCESLIGCPFELRRVWSRAGVPMASDVVDNVCPCLEEQDVQEGQLELLSAAFKQEMLKNLTGKNLGQDIRFLNKCPHLCNKLGLVKSLFPEAIFLWTLRDLTEVVTSLKNLFLRPHFRDIDCYHEWPPLDSSAGARCFSVTSLCKINQLNKSRCFPGGNIRYLAEYWLESNRAVMAQLSEVPDHRKLVVNHQHVLKQPQQVARQVEGVLQLDAGRCEAIVRDSNGEATRQWKHGLTDEEQHELDVFMQQNRQEVNDIFAAASR